MYVGVIQWLFPVFKSESHLYPQLDAMLLQSYISWSTVPHAFPEVVAAVVVGFGAAVVVVVVVVVAVVVVVVDTVVLADVVFFCRCRRRRLCRG